MGGRLEGKVALVTGASSGIGRASALAFAREGAKVVVADVAVEGGQETVQMVKQGGGEAIFVATDVAKAVQVEALVDKVIETYGRLDCAHNNAGISIAGHVTDISEDDWDRMMNVNLKGVWLCMKYEILQMLRQGGGAIVNTSSAMGLVGSPGSPAYSASKHGVIGLTKSAALVYGRASIRINAVCPGVINTPVAHKAGRMAQVVGREGTPEEVAEAVVWLCSDAASFVTGHAMAVDGGEIAQ